MTCAYYPVPGVLYSMTSDWLSVAGDRDWCLVPEKVDCLVTCDWPGPGGLTL